MDQTTLSEKTLVNAKTYKVNKDGSITFDLPGLWQITNWSAQPRQRQ
ncbi:MAG: hypothetical protein ACLRTZ_17815 [Agathobacter sp.]